MMGKAIEYYTIGKIGTDEICFPEDMVWCRHCKRAYQDSLGRKKCPVLDRLIFDDTTIWEDCPITFDGIIRGTKRGAKNE